MGSDTEIDYRDFLETLSNNEDDDNEEEEEGEEEVDQIVARFISEVTSHTTSSQQAQEDANSNMVLWNSGGGVHTTSSQEVVSWTRGGVETTPSFKNDEKEEEELNRCEIDGLCCPICMEAWSNGGDHHVCCLPCGHIYGMSCIKKWLQHRRSSGECPQCKRKCSLKDVRVLYASRVVVVDDELQKKVQSLKSKCASFEKEGAEWCAKEVEWQKIEAGLHLQVRQLTERTSYLEGLLGDEQSKLSGSFPTSWGCQGQATFRHTLDFEFGRQGGSSGFLLQKTFQVDGARFFDVDASNQILVIARRLSGMGGMHVLTKISLIDPCEREDVQLPVSTKAVRDLHISPHGRLALLASLGKKLSVLSTESNNTVLTYDLPAAAWSCSWDCSNSHYLYAGLQNGMLLDFDMRQTSRPVESITGLTCNPIHTIHALSHDATIGSGVRTLLTASSVGLCQWSFGGGDERPFLIPESENQGVCISLAYCPTRDDIVASFRPKVDISGDMVVSQPFLTPFASPPEKGVQGSHVIYKRLGSSSYKKLGSTFANVDDIRLPKSAIIDTENCQPLFASGDEVTRELLLHELPSLMTVQRLKSPKHPIRDVKYKRILNLGLLGCLSEDVLQLFSGNFL